MMSEDIVQRVKNETVVRDMLKVLRDKSDGSCVFGLKEKDSVLFVLLCVVIRKTYPKFICISDISIQFNDNFSGSNVKVKCENPIVIPLFNVLKQVVLKGSPSQQYRCFVRDQIDDFRRAHKGT